MAKKISSQGGLFGMTNTEYTDVEYVKGLLEDQKIQYALYRHWKTYFDTYCGTEFFILENKDHIVHNAFTILWEKVRTRMIYVENDVLKGRDGEPFTCALTTYLMQVAKINNLELVRDNRRMTLIDDLRPKKTKDDCNDDGYSILNTVSSEPVEESPFLDTSAEMMMREILASTIANMSEGCSQILRLFYYEEMNLDSIMNEMTSYKSKDALKTAKNKCLGKLKEIAQKQYKNYLNS